MIDPYMLRRIAEAKATIDRLAPELSWIQEHAEEATRLARQIEAMTARFSSPFDKFVLQDRIRTYLQKLADDHARMVAWAERGQKDHMLISVALPKRGWVLERAGALHTVS